MIVTVMMAVILLLLVSAIVSWKSVAKKTLFHWLCITLLCTAALLQQLVQNPIYLLYLPSFWLSCFVRSPPFLDRTAYFPNYTMFEEPATFAEIKREVDLLLARTNSGNNLPFTRDSYGGENQAIGADVKLVNGIQRAWRLLNIKAGDLYSEVALQYFPFLVSILKQLPEVQSCVISVLEPGIQIPIHVGYYKGILRYMLPTHIPNDKKNVYLCVNGIKYHWAEGDGVLWDDTFPHKVNNNTNEIRVLLYMDVVRPLDEPIAWFNSVNRKIIKLATGSSIVQNEIKRTEKQIRVTHEN